MRIDITDAPNGVDEAFVVSKTREHNAAFTKKDGRALCAFVRDESGSIIGGLTGMTYWGYLDIAYLWVDAHHRGEGLATTLMQAAESEACRRGCANAIVDTYSFQALGFYQKLGYVEFGRISGFSGTHMRHYLHKIIGSYVGRGSVESS